MEGQIKVEAAAPATADKGISITRDPTDLPPSVGERGPTTVRYELEAIERIGRLDDDTTYGFWTFNGKVPGPMLRVRVDDTVVARSLLTGRMLAPTVMCGWPPIGKGFFRVLACAVTCSHVSGL